MTPLGLIGLLVAAYALIRRWERLQRREAGSEREQDRQPEPETAVRRP
jgi:hypothetical protein